MDSFAKKYLIGLGVAALAAAAWWLLSLDFRVSELNSLLAADQKLSGYPYQFRVLSLEDGTAAMTSPRSASVPVVQFLTAVFPALRNLPMDDPAVMAAQDQGSAGCHAGPRGPAGQGTGRRQQRALGPG